MKYELLARSRIQLNQYNPNEMDIPTLDHLAREIQRVGFLQPILVRQQGEGFVIIDGEHRFKASEGITEHLPCIIIETDEERAKVLTINMNNIKGDFDPFKLASLLKGLETTFGRDDLKDLLNFSELELDNYKALTELPDDLSEQDMSRKDRFVFIICPSCKTEFNSTEAKTTKKPA